MKRKTLEPTDSRADVPSSVDSRSTGTLGPLASVQRPAPGWPLAPLSLSFPNCLWVMRRGSYPTCRRSKWAQLRVLQEEGLRGTDL